MPVTGYGGAILRYPSGGGAQVYLLDSIVTQPTFAISTRKLRAAYSGACMRIGHLSIPAQDTDIGFVGDELDVAAISAWCVANNVAASMLKWYDQSGNGRDAVHAAATLWIDTFSAGVNHPQTANSNPAPWLDGDSGRGGMTGSGFAISNIVTASAFTVLTSHDVHRFTPPAAQAGTEVVGIIGDGSNGYMLANGFYNNTVNDVLASNIYDGADKQAKITISAGLCAALSTFGSGTLSLYYNGGSPATVASSNIQVVTQNFILGTSVTVNDLNMLEALVFNSKLSAADINMLANGSNIIKGNIATRAGVTWSNIS